MLGDAPGNMGRPSGNLREARLCDPGGCASIRRLSGGLQVATDSDLDKRAAGRVGTTLRHKYHLDRVLGTGGMATVYAATHRNRRRFAIKMLHPEISMNLEVRRRFLREGHVANAVEHPGAVAVLDEDVTEDGAAFLVMELLEGASAEAVCERQRGRRLPVGAVLALAHELLDVLAAAHAKGIVHRDVKPANVFVGRDGQVKLLDFGIARLRDGAGAAATQTGTLLGTPAFMAPEQALAKSSEIDAQTDLWAAGATMFALLSGALVHEGENAAQVLVRAATTPAPALGSAAPDVPGEVARIVDRALAFEKRARWPSAEAMREAVAGAYGALCGQPVSPAPLRALHEAEAVGRAHTVAVSAAGAPAAGVSALGDTEAAALAGTTAAGDGAGAGDTALRTAGAAAFGDTVQAASEGATGGAAAFAPEIVASLAGPGHDRTELVMTGASTAGAGAGAGAGRRRWPLPAAALALAAIAGGALVVRGRGASTPAPALALPGASGVVIEAGSAAPPPLEAAWERASTVQPAASASASAPALAAVTASPPVVTIGTAVPRPAPPATLVDRKGLVKANPF
jgi:eukaryotic-like serine/threonine-protein kinase